MSRHEIMADLFAMVGTHIDPTPAPENIAATGLFADCGGMDDDSDDRGWGMDDAW